MELSQGSHSAATPATTPLPSPALINRNSQVVVTQKSNHVSTVLLYGIPIVSLYIEGQERLCLAQISNTLLKQFSYNEIHNRRVALGITCVQCTPVQLEILRRAGAMPVSSRRCGMITRREAERLCKSFLGDNAPPRLPDDFAFSVHHKCAWGCRGSFLPSRYNSSRAKCIKCSYCGMFFSPNKFIFHSHRISAGDKYVQPDAANFNSWRRHMMLSGQPPEEIVHAWEDVKAMFNGGTRKRLMGHSSAMSPTPSSAASAASSASAAAMRGSSSSAAAGGQCEMMPHGGDASKQAHTHNKDVHALSPSSPKRPREHGVGIGTVTAAAAAVVGVTAVAAAVGAVRPLNLHQHQPSVIGAPGQSRIGDHEMPLMPFSRSFMMDYMWHAQAAQNAAQQHQQKAKNGGGGGGGGGSSAFTFPNCTLPWIKASGAAGGGSSLLFDATAQVSAAITAGRGNGAGGSSGGGGGSTGCHMHDNPPYSTTVGSAAFKTAAANAVAGDGAIGSNLGALNKYHDSKPAAGLPQLLTASAFKPVLQHNQQHALNAVAAVAAASAATATLVSSSMYSTATASLSSASSASSSSRQPSGGCVPSAAGSETATSSAAAASLALTVHANLCTSPGALLFPPPRALLLSRSDSHRLEGTSSESSPPPPPAPAPGPVLPPIGYIKESHSSDEDNANNDTDDDDDEMVDIETTEEEAPAQNLHLISAHLPSPAPTPTLTHPPSRAGSSSSSGRRACAMRCSRDSSTDDVDVDGEPEERYSSDEHEEEPGQLDAVQLTITATEHHHHHHDTGVHLELAHGYDDEGEHSNFASQAGSTTSSDSQTDVVRAKSDSHTASLAIEAMEAQTFATATAGMWKDTLKVKKRRTLTTRSKKQKAFPRSSARARHLQMPRMPPQPLPHQHNPHLQHHGHPAANPHHHMQTYASPILAEPTKSKVESALRLGRLLEQEALELSGAEERRERDRDRALVRSREGEGEGEEIDDDEDDVDDGIVDIERDRDRDNRSGKYEKDYKSDDNERVTTVGGFHSRGARGGPIAVTACDTTTTTIESPTTTTGATATGPATTTTSPSDTVLFDALTHCHKTTDLSNNNNNNTHSNNNYNTISNNNEFWHVASRLYLQRPTLNYEAMAPATAMAAAPQQPHSSHQQLQPQQQQPLYRMPLYYNRQQQQQQQQSHQHHPQHHHQHHHQHHQRQQQHQHQQQHQQSQQQHQQQPPQQQQQQQQPHHHNILLMEKTYPLNTFRYLGHEVPTRGPMVSVKESHRLNTI